MSNGEFSAVYKVWTFGPLVKEKVTIGETLALWSRFKNSIEIVPTEGGGNYAIYATNPAAEQRLETWMLENAPLASSALMRPEAISN